MEIKAYRSAGEMLSRVRAYLEREEALNNLILGVAGSLAALPQAQQSDNLYFSLHVDDAPQLVALVAPPPYGLLLYSHLQAPQEAADVLAAELRRRAAHLYGVNGVEKLADVFVDGWARGNGSGYQLMIDMSAFQLDRVIPPRPAAGFFRPAEDADKPVIEKFARAFTAEALDEDEDQAARIMLERVDGNQVYVWEDGGTVTCMVAWNRPTRRGVAVNQVYTPPEHRRRGYAINAVAALSAVLLARGHAFCCLFTDKANPTSNSIYRQIGYRHIGDCRHYRFH